MGVAFMIVVGAVLGWLTAIIFQIEDPRGVLMNIAAGIGGALFAGLLLAPLLSGAIPAVQYRAGSLLVPLVGSAALVALLNLLHRSQAR